MHELMVWIQAVLVPKLGALGIFCVAFVDSSFLSLPEINDVLVVTAADAVPRMAWLPVAMATLGSVAGCLVLWEIGRRGGERLLVRRFGSERMDRTRRAFRRWDVLALGIPALLPPPMPFKIFVLSAGVFGVSSRRFVATLVVARGLRYGFWAMLGILYGQQGFALLRSVDAWVAARIPLIGAACGAVLLALLAVYALRRWRAGPERALPESSD